MQYYIILMKPNRIKFTDLVIPFICAYVFMYVMYSIFGNVENISFIVVLLITASSFLLMYGLFAFVRDFSHVLSSFSDSVIKLFKDVITKRF